MSVKFISGGHLGTVEESFASKLNPGDTFWFAGQNLEFVRIKDLTVLVKKSKRKSGLTPAWGGGRLPLSSLLSDQIRAKLQLAIRGNFSDPELQKIKPIADEHGVPLAQLVINWTIQRPGITAALVGARNSQQAEENAKSMSFVLSQDEVERINAELEKVVIDHDV